MLAVVARVLVVAAWVIGAGLSDVAGAAATEVKRVLLCLLTRVAVDHEQSYRYPAIVAGVGALVLVVG